VSGDTSNLRQGGGWMGLGAGDTASAGVGVRGGAGGGVSRLTWRNSVPGIAYTNTYSQLSGHDR
jgi:hypothetical protein